ncbi:tetratricopeptide repeat protein [Aquimarina sp. 2201CG14-23]|uniref:tetratricopeptide repeat protein n=1 Tax=Aquimarina mycalae TaxID=3040073 RepID=UPI0024781474|nr:tetratricopeptide repeat protein [Aquimarina sp. 2201CG14-23]MDH7447315.1 tetratricopeptide repeat protein [Aquimarina sp. 2201CG14-23]
MKHVLIILLCFQFGIIFSQEEDREATIAEANRFVATGNEVLVKDGNFPKAEGEYRKAISKNPIDPNAKYNLANAYYNSEKYDEATQRYTEAVKVAESKAEKHKAFHNQGNTFMEQKKYKEAVEAYKNALRNNPKDNETRYNLALAKKMLEEEQKKNDQNKDDNKDKDNKDENKDKNEDNKDKEGDNKEDKKEGEDDKDKKGDEGEDKKDQKGEDEKDQKGDPKDEGKDKKEDKKEGDGKPEEQKQQPKQAQGQLSPQQVKSLLEAMNNEEKKVQDKINAKKAQGAKTRTEKDW